MAGLFGLSINPEQYQGTFTEDLFWGTFYQRHLGEEDTGLGVLKDDWIVHDSREGLFAPNFRNRMHEFNGTSGIGYCGNAKEPFFSDSAFGAICVAFTGNIINREDLLAELKNLGHLIDRGDDIEVIFSLIVREAVKKGSLVEGIIGMTERIKGSYSLLLLSREQGLYAVCCPEYRWPLIIGKKEGAAVVSVETGGFNNLGLEVVRVIEPGEIVLLKNGAFERVGRMKASNPRICSFRWDYTDFAASLLLGIPASLVRKKLGKRLAQGDIKAGFFPHIVVPVPDSGRFHAIGYYQEFICQLMLGNIKRVPLYDEYFIKYGFDRSFLRPTDAERRKTARYKLVISAETVKHFLQMLEEASMVNILQDIKNNGRIILVICEDSVVRGTQVEENLVPKAKRIFEASLDDGTEIKVEIHVRASYPALLSHCRWGKTTKIGETLAQQCPDMADRIKRMKIDGLAYSEIEDLAWAIGLPLEKLCYDCALADRD